ncbi:HAD family hydrolase [Actinophytocola xanthii]|uniref:Haloacid dehalogenase n=1 Tax=Actinophytocola xanthii TaxID=1912961 RepID=A0A1Q8BVG6_9PSEU|nr:haloacid dehalogenase-like hydrolase [Actinophytocola xanthii]OLF06081.1 haloacid dehalogenase [Actinophytocola xanthii]
MHTLVLWDIDLTLVDYSGLGRTWYARALANLVGKPMTHQPFFPGRTERSLAREILAAHDEPDGDEQVERLFAELEAIALAERESLPMLGRALAGAPEILAVLARRAGVVQSLVTGNLPTLASCKLAAFDLHHHVDLDIGGYGSLSEHRHDLVEAAIRQATDKHGHSFAPRSVVVVGDTPADVAAGRHHGTVTVGVATGRFTVEELADSGADVVLPDLADTDAVLAALEAS